MGEGASGDLQDAGGDKVRERDAAEECERGDFEEGFEGVV